MPDQNALYISEELLSRSGATLLRRDFEAFAQCFHFPNEVETVDGVRRLEKADDLRGIYENVLDQFARMSVTHMDRRIVEACFRDADSVHCTHETRLLRDTTLLQPPYPVFSILTRDFSGGWKIAYSSYALGPSTADPLRINASILQSAPKPKPK